MGESKTEDKKPKHLTKRKEEGIIETSLKAPFPFDYIERQLRKKTFGILTTVTPQGRPHSVGVVYAVAPPGQPFCLYLITRPVLKKARNIRDNPNVSFAVPFPHYLFRSIPPRCIQFQGKAELLPIDDPIVIKAFQSSIVLKRSMEHSLRLGESVFIRIVPDKKIFCFGIGANILQFLIPSQNKNLGNFYVIVPENRRMVKG
jgi:Pyridoxamine 5'-phosphate oxidase